MTKHSGGHSGKRGRHPSDKYRDFYISRRLANGVMVSGKYWSKAQIARELGVSYSTAVRRVKILQDSGEEITLAALKDEARFRVRPKHAIHVTVPKPILTCEADTSALKDQ